MRENSEQYGLITVLRELPMYDLDARHSRDIRNRACALLSRGEKKVERIWRMIDTLYCSVAEPLLATGFSAAFLAWVAYRCYDLLTRFPN